MKQQLLNMAPKYLIKNHKELLIDEILSQSESAEINLTNPIFLYLSKKQAEIYLKAINTRPLLSQLHYPIIYLIFKHVEQFLSSFDNTIDVIDLGPGLPDKTAPIIDYIQAYKKGLRYIPVDVNQRFLNISFDYFKYKQIRKLKLNVLLNELESILTKDKRFNNSNNRLFNIGLTFNNYDIEEMINMFSTLLDQKSLALIATELIDKLDEEHIIKPYETKESEEFNFQMLKEIGFVKNDFSYHVSFEEGKIKMGFLPKHQLKKDKIILSPNQPIITSISYRYFENDLISTLSSHFNHLQLFKNGKSNVCLITFKAK